ncbi:MAG: hypothetical protein EA381_19705 [Planctomycetaceae bacterium]|nr:MAG: hypothetical protein EA381_19705 [Planctomycetaceae bacterium]
MAQQISLHLPNLIQKSGKLTLHLVETPSNRVIGSLSVPPRLTPEAMRRAEFRIGWAQIGKFIQQTSKADGPEASTVSIDLPGAFSKIAAIRLTDAAPEVLMIGNPLYNNPREPWFAMEPHFVFSDSAWLLPRGPFGQAIAPIPPGSQFQIVSTDENWGFDATHQSGTERFYRVGVQHRLEGNLQPITSDLGTALLSLRKRNYQEFPKLDLEQVAPNAIGEDDRIWKMTIPTVAFEPK